MRKIDVKLGQHYSDATSEYIITFPKGMTVGEFIDEWLSYDTEWGYFGIKCKSKDIKFLIFGNPYCEYKYGEIIGEPLPKEYLDKKIKNVTGSGGWSRSDFLFTV